MIISYVYKLKPSNWQAILMERWLDMLRAFFNFCLRDRIEAYEQVSKPVLGNYSRLDNQGECCPLACSVNKTATVGYPWRKNGKRRSAGMQQDAYLPEMKIARPWYKSINADVLQMNLRRLNDAYSRFFDGQGGYPNFKSRSKFRSLVPALFSSQECNQCGHVSPVNRKGEKFLCEKCSYFIDADSGAANNLLNRGLKTLGISEAETRRLTGHVPRRLTQLRGVPSEVTLMESSKEETSLRLLDDV